VVNFGTEAVGFESEISVNAEKKILKMYFLILELYKWQLKLINEAARRKKI